MLVIVCRTIILYAIVIISLRVMGKRQIGELQPSELVVAIMISDLASVPMQAIDIPLINGIIPVLTLMIAEVCMSYATLKSRHIRRFITGEPSIIICNGHVNEHELERLRFNLNDLLEELRMNGYPNIANIDMAILETNGQISIVPSAASRPVTVSDLKIKDAKPDCVPYLIISDGKINKDELTRSNRTIKWLEAELKKKNISDIKKIFIASLDYNGELFIQMKNTDDCVN